MFKNPLKYQQGGQLNEQQQQMLAAFIDWLPKRVKEFQGMQPDAIVQALDGMSKTPEGQKQVQQLMEQFQQESQSVPSAKRGGKIQDFICKHGRGGAVAGCGCEKSVLKGQEAIPGGMPRFQAPTNYYNEKGWPISERDAVRRNNRTFYTEEPTTAGNLAWTNNQMSSQLMWPGVVQDVQYNLPVGHYIDEYGNMHNFAVQGEDLTRYNNRKAQWKGDGGKVEKAQDGNIVDYYTNKWGNDWNRVKQGWNRFTESAPGKVLKFFMPNPNSETGMLGAAAPIGKISNVGLINEAKNKTRMAKDAAKLFNKIEFQKNQLFWLPIRHPKFVETHNKMYQNVHKLDDITKRYPEFNIQFNRILKEPLEF